MSSAQDPTGARDEPRLFSPATRAWFRAAFPAGATPAQTEAWDAISREESTLVVAPTGSGKTLAAFLWGLDDLARRPAPEDRGRRCRLLYVSPLKALATDIEKNLRAPLSGIRRAARERGAAVPDITVGVRTGDTPASQRRALAAKPPDVLITTPESLFLVLTSRARSSLAGVETVIVDEVHSLAGTKRGAHLALSLERLDALLDRSAQRIGLSATVRPAEEVAYFLGGASPAEGDDEGRPRPVTVVAPPHAPNLDLSIAVPVEDMTELDAAVSPSRADDTAAKGRTSIWPHVEERIHELVMAHRSSIVFCNSRRVAERLCARLNELGTGQGAARPAEPPAGEDPSAEAARPGEAPSAVPDTSRTNTAAPEAVPAELMGQAGQSAGAARVVARAHHGSVSKSERAVIEADLKEGRLPCVVATSSLELGIDMGAVDLVIQVESPPSVANGLQRVGRAGHQVDEVSRGVVFPKYRGDLLATAVVAERMRAGEIEELRMPRNPLDVLAQQIVAMAAMDEWSVPGIGALARRAAPFAALPDSALSGVLDMLSGRYPSDEFAELRPRLVWDREAGRVRGRPGAQQVAVTSGGTIPDRGTYAVHLAGGASRGAPTRVGELDEEMVYESRVGDVFVLGASSWRIDEITADRVLVSPAPGRPGRLPFWKADALGRPMELGRAIGAWTRQLTGSEDGAARERASAAGLDAWAASNLIGYLEEQREATGVVPDDSTIVVERFRDELGDWRAVVHSPLGARVHAPWALAIGARLRERYGLDAQVVHGDDGIVLRLPDVEDPGASGASRSGVLADLITLPSDEVEEAVTSEIGGSALFAARFRECAGRALLLPRRRPGRRMPLWQQRQRSAQLLAVAGRYGSFPIVLEAVRECLRDVFDVPGLAELMSDIGARRVRVVEVETPRASPFAQSLLIGYTAAFLYEGDAPLAELKAQALTLDSALLADLLGQADLRELLDPGAVAELDAWLQRLAPERRVGTGDGVEETADLLRELGPLSTAEARQRGVDPGWLTRLEAERRAIPVRIAGDDRWAAIEDAARLRDGLGVALPGWLSPAAGDVSAGDGASGGGPGGEAFVGAAEAFTAPVADPLGDLVSRYARTHGPFTAEDVANRFGVDRAVVVAVLRGLVDRGRVVEGEFRPVDTVPPGTPADSGAAPKPGGTEWCDADILRRLRRRSASKLRHEIEPAPQWGLARFVPAWQHVSPPHVDARAGGGLRGPDAVFRAVESLRGAPVPASALESLVLPARVPGYAPAQLDELTVTGEVLWAGAGPLAGNDGWLCLVPADEAELLLPERSEADRSAVHEAVLDALREGGALFFRDIADRVIRQRGAAAVSDADLVAAVWDLVWAGWIGNDTLAPLRALLGAGGTRHRSSRRPVMPSRTGPPTVAGRWWVLPERESDPTLRAHAQTAALLDRYGVVTRGSVVAEQRGDERAKAPLPGRGSPTATRARPGGEPGAVPGTEQRGGGRSPGEESGPPVRGRASGSGRGPSRSPGGFAAIYPVLRAFEESGKARRGYFVDGLGAAQFALPGAVDRLRALGAEASGAGERGSPLVLAATDPANVYGAALPWPKTPEAGARPGRKAGALVVIDDGDLVLYLERGGRTALTFASPPEELERAATALAGMLRAGRLATLTVERADGRAVFDTELGGALTNAGFHATPKGLRLRS
ncbi:ATP-dependent Lhr-like helicase [Lipingzhangella halophila]|uniref:ATP-dependent Lhr-like helicase n=1 Tax=Lipingzhangella halophila TaxID=1783352 RepID=A0A7W7W146_9ACTN|nr:DEAD/DEAH box helicase [Lipingzhangella halophila]MBB4930256.1 ATP-dependent Lhr-like helicase [Lipingzhangella halophila]